MPPCVSKSFTTLSHAIIVESGVDGELLMFASGLVMLMLTILGRVFGASFCEFLRRAARREFSTAKVGDRFRHAHCMMEAGTAN